ncbi:MAG TPA: MFS transporter, partial [Stellaceae bacterium]|nr:MFS transporter [Stellaceae bacterium]
GVGTASFVAAALTDFVSWRAAFIVPGAVAALIGIALAVLVRGRHVVALKTDRRPEAEPDRGDVRRAFIVLSITMLLAGLMFQILVVSMPKLFDLRLTGLTSGGTLGTGGFVSLVFMVSAGVQIIGGWLADRFSLRRVYVLCWAAQIPVLFLITNMREAPLLALMTLLFSLETLTGPAENSLLVRYTPGRWRATAFGAKFVLSLGVASLGVPIAGWVFDSTGDFSWLYGIMGVCVAVIVAAALFLPRDGDRYVSPAVVPAE